MFAYWSRSKGFVTLTEKCLNNMNKSNFLLMSGQRYVQPQIIQLRFRLEVKGVIHKLADHTLQSCGIDFGNSLSALLVHVNLLTGRIFMDC